MTREEAIWHLKRCKKRIPLMNTLGELCKSKTIESIDMAIESLKKDKLIEAIANEMSCEEITETEQYAKGYADGLKESLSAEPTIEKCEIPHESKPTDLISRADAIEAVENLQTEQWIDSDIDYNNGLESAVAEIKALPSAEQVTSKLKNPCDSLLKADSESCKEQKSKLDLISRADALEQMAQAECGLHYEDCEADNCACDYIWRILNIPSADRPSGEWVEKEVMVDEDANITEWQSAKCSVCGKYHTTPYMYYFDSFNYCPNCGAKMGGDTR